MSGVGVAATKRVQIRTCTKYLHRHQGTQSPRPSTHTSRRIGTHQLVDGYAECFGAELATGIAYLFGGECKAVIYTHSGCTLEMSLLFVPSTSLQSLTPSSLTSMENPQQNTPLRRRPWVTISLQVYFSSKCVFCRWRQQLGLRWTVWIPKMFQQLRRTSLSSVQKILAKQLYVKPSSTMPCVGNHGDMTNGHRSL